MKYPKFAGKYSSPGFTPKAETIGLGFSPPPRGYSLLDTARSRVTPGGSTARQEDKIYTGTAMVGVATMHKSNLVPVFTSEQATDLASMRR